MQTPTLWLNPDDVTRRLNLPKNFVTSVFNPYLYEIEKNELRVLLGAQLLTDVKAWLIINPFGLPNIVDPDPDAPPVDPVVPDEKMIGLYDLLVDFLVYAVYAEYIIQGSIQATATGLVRKNRESSENLSDIQQMQLHKTYRSRADNRSKMITDYIRVNYESPSNDCKTPFSFSGVQFSSSYTNTKSILD